MEEEKAAAYYDELCRKGSNAARFKQGLGFSSDYRPTTTTSSSLSSFVRASSPTKSAALDKQAQLQKIQNKLSKPSRRPSPDRHRSRERDHRHRSSSRERGGGDGRNSRQRRRSRERSRSRSPDRRRIDSRNGDRKMSRGKSGGGVDYHRAIDGYEKMTPAERVKARMKFQLSETAAKDSVMGTGSRWERFAFNKDAPLDDDEDELETAADDDAALVKNMGKSFRFSAVEAKRDEQIKAAHDEAMFGVPVASAVFPFQDANENVQEEENHVEESSSDNDKKQIENPLLSEKVISMQQSSWRDRARKSRNAES